MFAVIKTGGKQYEVSPGRLLKIEKLTGSEGDSIEFKEVLMFFDGQTSKVGTPFLEEVTVKATLVDQIKDKKIIVFKKKRRQGYQRTNGHRQPLTRAWIESILVNGKPVAHVPYINPGVQTKETPKNKRGGEKRANSEESLSVGVSKPLEMKKSGRKETKSGSEEKKKGKTSSSKTSKAATPLPSSSEPST